MRSASRPRAVVGSIYDAIALEGAQRGDTRQHSGLHPALSVSVSAAQEKRDGKRFQRVTASVLHAGQPVEAAWRVDGKEVEKIKLAAGRQSFDLLVPGAEKVRSAGLALMAGAGRLQASPCCSRRVSSRSFSFLKRISILATPDLATNVVQRYRTTMIDRALEVADQNRDLPPDQQFVWTISGWPMHEILDWPDQSIERKQQRRGRLKARAVCGPRLAASRRTASCSNPKTWCAG